MAAMYDEEPDPIFDSLIPGQTPTRSQVAANRLRVQNPQKISSSVSTNVSARFPVAPADSTAYGPGNTGVSSLRGAQVERANKEIGEDYAELDKLSGPQDYTRMSEYARERSEGGQKSLVAALAAQAAGKEFEPIGGAMLKRAMASKEPLKTATGFINPDTGEHVEDPMAKTEQRSKLINARIARNEQIINSAASAEEKAEAQRQNAELKKLQMAQTFAIQQMTKQIAMASAQQRNSGAGDKIGARVYDDFYSKTKDQHTQLNAFNNLKATAQRTDAASDLSLIFQYMKMLDPNSVVRETEFANAENARGVPESIRNLQNRIMNGQRLTPAQRTEFLGTAENLAKEADTRIGVVRSELAQQMEAMGLDPTPYLPGYKRTMPGAPPEQSMPPMGSVRPKAPTSPDPAKAAQPAPAYPQGAVRPKGGQ